ncbi:methyltransferase domain-containing protein [Diaminobutyricimonas sp. TR449]|uniref:methyltransferase domain-containing protein n=1 Tax=Diaminobutyricimonas sp. TR449 TaxID=2708076 RepID=UPI00141FBC7F|nr:methyltransferase domain-containing protein [Diaminobutyricimonas sp. TR449]
MTAADYETRRDALVDRIVDSYTAGSELFTIELGRRLGLYRTLHKRGPLSPRGLAEAAGIAERYAREWLEQQAAAGFVDVDDEATDAAARQYRLPDAHIPVLVHETDPSFTLGMPALFAGSVEPFAAVIAAFRSGAGVPYDRYGPHLRWGIAAMNRPGFEHDLAHWVAAVDGVAEWLAHGGTVLDAGCGEGWSTIALAKAFPAARVHGVDLDAASIETATANAEAAGVGDRVRFTLANAAGGTPGGTPAGGYDFACVFEALHDMGDPVAVLRGIRSTLSDAGVVLIGDEKVADEFTAPADKLDRMQYAVSVLHCLPATMAESTAVANGTVLRAPTVRRWAAEAGFGSVEVLPIEHDFWRFYALRP